jgi:PAS domain S-box-containing protein
LTGEGKTSEEPLEEPAGFGDAAAHTESELVPEWRPDPAPDVSDSNYRLLIDNTLDIITVLDREGRVAFNSHSLQKILGYEPRELNGMHALELVHPDDLERLTELLYRGIQIPGFVGNTDYRFRHKDGSWCFLESIFNNLLDDPSVNGIVVASRDVTDRKRMENRLKESEEYFRAVTENSLDIIMIIDDAANIRYVNRSSRRLLDYDPEEMTGRNGLEFIHPDDVGWASEMIGTAARNPEYSPLREIRVRHKDGSWRYLEGIGKSFLAHPAVRGIVLSFRDITDRRHAELELRDSEEMYRTLASASPDGITVTDMKAAIQYVSPQLVELHVFQSEDELLGTSALDLIAPEDRDRGAAEMARMLKSGHARNVELTLIRKDGSRFQAELNAALIKDAAGEPWRMVSFTRDISERKRIDRELRDRNEELEAFAHTISHDLLTPVAIVEGYAKAALEADAEGRAEAERECLEAIAKGARRMSDLINSLLQFAQAGHVDIESFGVDPEEVLMEVLMDLEEDIRKKKVRVELAADMPHIEVDAVKLRQVLGNLLSNAIKHMGDNSEPYVEVSASAQGGTATFCVRDNGIGIPSELHRKIFEPFRHFSLAGSPGLGIGLSTVKRAVKAWGGRAWVESSPGEGAAFFFTAPLAD